MILVLGKIHIKTHPSVLQNMFIKITTYQKIII